MKTQVKSIMTAKLFSVPAGTSLYDAHLLMKDKRIRHLPITDEDNDVVGVLSQRDIAAIPDSKSITVEMMMSAPVENVHVDMPLRQAVLKMLQKKISCLLIVDHDDSVAGIVTTDDILWFVAHLLADEQTDHSQVFSLSTRQTIGALADQLSQVGI